MQHLMTSDGEIVLPGVVLRAEVGPHAGTHWRLEEIFHNGVTHMLRCTRLHKVGRVVQHLHPSVFGLTMVEVKAWFKVTRHDVMTMWRKVDEWLFAGIFALGPLAIFEHYHLADPITAFLTGWFTGGGH